MFLLVFWINFGGPQIFHIIKSVTSKGLRTTDLEHSFFLLFFSRLFVVFLEGFVFKLALYTLWYL